MKCRESAATVMPGTVLPMLATSASAFDDPGWVFELKWDGVRAMTSISEGRRDCVIW
jgi:bifunctional non-homologous end joining protein LigD